VRFRDTMNAICDMVPLEDAIERYTGHRIRNHRTNCPIHEGDGQNMRTDNNIFYCYVCHAHGNVVQFVQEYFRLDGWQALSKLNTDYDLGLFPHYYDEKAAKILRDSRARRLAEMSREEAIKHQIAALSSVYGAWCAWRRGAAEDMIKYRPKDPGGEIDERYAEAVKWWDYINYNMDELELEFFRLKGELRNGRKDAC